MPWRSIDLSAVVRTDLTGVQEGRFAFALASEAGLGVHNAAVRLVAALLAPEVDRRVPGPSSSDPSPGAQVPTSITS